MSVEQLDDVERRVLAHLPAWRTQKDAKDAERLETTGHSDKEAAEIRATPTNPDDDREGTDEDPRIATGAGHHVSSYTVSELTERLRADDHLPLYLAKRVIERGDVPRPLDDLLVADELTALKARGLAWCDEQDQWTMTKQGFLALTAPEEETA